MKAHQYATGNLLRAVVRMRQADACAKTFAELASKIDCWEKVIESARLHGILPMLFSRITAIEDALPPEVIELARNEFERNAFQCFANAAELLEVLSVFEAAQIPALPFKGVVLGASVYGDITARTAGDLDVLIHYRDLLPAAEILKARGYCLTTKVLEDGSPEARNYFEYHFERPEDGMVLELRWRLELTQPRYKRDLGMAWAWPRRRTTCLAGAEVPNFDAISELLMLCMHGSKHAWSRLVWICDVAKFLDCETALDWSAAIAEANRLGLWRCLALGVLLAHRLAGANVPAEVLECFERDQTARDLAIFFQKHVPCEPGRVPDGRTPYDVQLLGFRERVGFLLSPAFLRPNARDRAIVKLPKALDPLYYLVRPFRLLSDRTAR